MTNPMHIIGALILALGAASAEAATQADPPPHLADLLRVDALGYECIAEADLDRAFGATGKPFRLPRTCLPAPCARQITRPDLGRLIGRPATRASWDDYVSRYAQACVHEALWPGEEATAPVASAEAERFWAPLLAPGAPRLPGPIFATRQGSVVAGPSGGGARVVSDVANGLGSPGGATDGGDATRGSRPDSGPPPAVVPLPPAAALGLAALAGLAALGLSGRPRPGVPWRSGRRWAGGSPGSGSPGRASSGRT